MIITVNREFGSGGRELGERLANALHIPCYDHEIIVMIAKKHGFDENYVAHVSEKSIQTAYPIKIGNRFTTTLNYATKQEIVIAVEQRKIIESLAKQGDCVIIGRCADVILQEYNPFNIFVYAEVAAKRNRYIDRASASEKLTIKELERKMREIDKNRASHRSFYSDTKWGEKSNYHLCVNTTGKEIESLVPAIAEYIKCWFEQK